MSKRVRAHIHDNLYGFVAIFIALGGTAWAANGPLAGTNTVGTADIINKEVKRQDLALDAINSSRVAPDSLTGPDIQEATLGPVPAIQAPEAWHEVGTPGEPLFQNGWNNSGGSLETVAFYKDREGVVHLKGGATGSNTMFIFQLPAGYRPASGKELRIAAVCNCTVTDSDTPPDEVNVPTGTLHITGNVGVPAVNGGVSISPLPSFVSLEGVTFRAGG